jgi:hypothetical protein
MPGILAGGVSFDVLSRKSFTTKGTKVHEGKLLAGVRVIRVGAVTIRE